MNGSRSFGLRGVSPSLIVSDGTDRSGITVGDDNTRIGYYLEDPIGPRFELYAANHATRAGEFVAVYGGEIAGGKVAFIHWGPGASFVTVLEVLADGLKHSGSTLGFFGATPTIKPAVSGSRSGNAALASLLTALAGLGLITDSTSA